MEQCDRLRRCRVPDRMSRLDTLSQDRVMSLLTPPFFIYIMLILRVEGLTADVGKIPCLSHTLKCVTGNLHGCQRFRRTI
jgi:hypothetical protein